MQKIFLCTCFALALFLHMPPQRANLCFLNGEHTFYSTQMQTFSGCNVLKNGKIYHISCNTQTAKTIDIKGVVGHSVKFEGTKQDFFKTCKMLGKIKSQYLVDNVLVAEGVSQKLEKSKNLGTNFQVSFDGKHITVGTPIIIGSF